MDGAKGFLRSLNLFRLGNLGDIFHLNADLGFTPLRLRSRLPDFPQINWPGINMNNVFGNWDLGGAGLNFHFPL